MNVDQWRISARQGDARSQVLIGEVSEFGAEGPADPVAAARWYLLAAFQDNPEAQFYLGVMYDRGIGVDRNTAESLRWLFRAAEQGQEKAQVFLALTYVREIGLRPEFVRRIHQYKQSAESGNAEAQYNLAWIYREGAGLPVNAQEALKWYHRAADQGNAKAQFALGEIYLEGKLAPVDPEKALAWYQKSALKEIRAQAKLCHLYKGAGGVRKNNEEAKKWSGVLAASTGGALRSYIDAQHGLLQAQKGNHPAWAMRACYRIAALDDPGRGVTNACNAIQQQIGDQMIPRVQNARAALEQKNMVQFRAALALLPAPDFDEWQLRRLIAPAWRLIEEDTRARVKIAQELLRSLESSERSVSYRQKNMSQVPRWMDSFKTIIGRGLRDHPGDADLLALAQRGKKIVASLKEKMKPPRRVKDKIEEKEVPETPEEVQEDVEPGEEDYKKAQALFDGGRFEESALLFDKTTKVRGTKYIASAYIYLGVSHLARINPANINEARKLRLLGVACFQNALRFDNTIQLPPGYHKYQPVFNEAKKQLR